MEVSRVTEKGQITLPSSIRRQMGISKGDTMGFALTRQGILIKPIHLIDKTRTPEWRKKLNQALHEIKSGQGEFYEDTKSFLKALEKI
ncbi:MAG: AbrB/MazE/SpoVT family DNA-binding domain-containing protein [Candidatus Sumerlaeota bacterium]|nr:AbrB/MazE/SpoVT family DNA-binding domain-containing protein [Candidatus Sumerlaeota bacterium]